MVHRLSNGKSEAVGGGNGCVLIKMGEMGWPLFPFFPFFLGVDKGGK